MNKKPLNINPSQLDFPTILKALRSIGPLTAVRSTLYSLYRDHLESCEKSSVSEPPAQSPGKMISWEAISAGVKITFENASLEVVCLTPDLARLSWEPGIPPVPYAIDRTNWPPISIEVDENPQGLLLRSSEMSLSISLSGAVSLKGSLEQQLFTAQPPQRRGEAWQQAVHLQPKEAIYGLGERAAPLNRRGRSYRMWNTDPGGSYGPNVDPVYICIPLYLGLHSLGSYLVFYENTYPAVFNFPAESDRAQADFEAGMLRYYLIPGPPDRALFRYSDLTGRTPLPPRWVFGYHQSRWGYKSEADIRAVLAGFQQHDLPLSAIHLDIDYMEGYRVFTVNSKGFPDLRQLASDLQEQGIKLVAILDPGVKRDQSYFMYQEGTQKYLFCKEPEGKPLRGVVWPGWSAYPDFTDPEARRWWGSHYPRLLEAGVAGFWHDMNEPTSFSAWGDITLPLTTRHALEGESGDHRAAHNVYALLMNRAGYEALRQFKPDQRPWAITRAGWAGLQRYAWNWTGDTETSWASMRQTIPTVLGLGFCGYLFSGPDIGGFSGDPSPELFLRWFQLAAFLPFFRGHSAIGTQRREPWVFGEPYTSHVRELLHLRYQLLPFFYTLAWQACQSGLPPVRPLFWGNWQDERLWAVDDAFLLGDSLLVAPIVEEGATERTVQLPAGDWVDFWDGQAYPGPGEITLQAGLGKIPLLVRAGTILPLEEGSQLTLSAYPNQAGLAEGWLYCDAGDGYGPSRLEHFKLAGKELLRDSDGEFPFPYDHVRVNIVGH